MGKRLDKHYASSFTENYLRILRIIFENNLKVCKNVST